MGIVGTARAGRADRLAGTDPLTLLARPDKWYLGAGDGLVWAPPFPTWLDAPGFWDEAHLFQYAVRPLFTVSFVTDGRALEGRCLRRRWTPAALVLEHRLGPLAARETRAAPGGAFTSDWAVENATRRPLALDVVVWTAVDGAALASADVSAGAGGLEFTRCVADRGHAARVRSSLRLAPRARSFGGVRSQISVPDLPPRFDLTPFSDRWRRNGTLGDRLEPGGLTADGLVFLGLQRRFRVPPKGTIAFSARITLSLDAPSLPVSPRLSPSLPVSPRPSPSLPASPRPSPSLPAPSWTEFFQTVPVFHCSDAHLDRYWWYRWYGLRLNGIAAGAAPNYPHPAVTEGIGYFHVPITYSAQCHVRELRWLPDPAWARGVLRTFLHHQKPDGSLHGRIYADHLEGTDFYHADWGGAFEALYAAHPDPAFGGEVYPALARYGRWLTRTRDGDGSGMLDVVDQFETGQEYMSRYDAVDPEADLRLKGVDITVYGYRLFQALARLAGHVAPAEAPEWRAAAERAGRAVREAMWDGRAGMFSDVDPATGRRTGVKAAVCFYPYGTDLVEEQHLAGLERHLFAPREFWTPFPVPSSSVDDPLFNPDAEWKGKRHNCPWNGRVWPMTNSHVIEALARVVRVHRPRWAPRLGELLRRFVRMMTFDGRPDRPNCFEHYHPYTGRPSVYRGIDDYQHSWVNDLIVSQLLGVLPRGAGGVTIHPLALGVTRAEVRGLPVAGRRLRVRIAGRRFEVWVDGRRAGRARVGDPLEIAF